MFTLPKLPYDYGALEPYIDAQTMEIHYTKHHQAYVDNLNKALAPYPELQQKSLTELVQNPAALPEAIRTAVRNNGGGHMNHSMFWHMMTPQGGGEPRGPVGQDIHKQFGTFAAFQDQFNAAAKSVFGSGWAWLCIDAQGKLVVTSTPNQDAPLAAGLHPVLGLDVWEHAYYLKYQNRRPDYITAWWHVINWQTVEERYAALVG
jgi:Fe-Mn family superoxide dismutase